LIVPDETNLKAGSSLGLRLDSDEEEKTKPTGGFKPPIGLSLDVSSQKSDEKMAPSKPGGFSNKKKPKKSLMIDTETINKNFTVGGEKGDFTPAYALEKLENDIQELASKCVLAMRRAKKGRKKTNF
jgi:hypothetical protein